jgi:NADPH:quinone reductase-like Zn-dependent oxidoreductase
MKAVRIHQYGGTDVLEYEEAPRPEPAPDEVLVRVHAAGINPADWKTRAGGGMAFRLNNPFPMIPGWDVSGVVEAVGTVVTKFNVGDAVFGMVRFPEVGSTYAEYVAVPEHNLALKPNNVDYVQAAAIPLAALTAWQGLFEHADLKAGQRLLIHGAAGGVGHLAVQIAKWHGAYVIGTASAPNLSFLSQLGVDEAVDYTIDNFETSVDPVDMVLDTVGGEMQSRLFSTIKDGGRLVSIAGVSDPLRGEKRHISATGMLVHIEPSHLENIAEMVTAEQIKANIAQVFPLSKAAQAHEVGAGRTVRCGKLVLVPDSISTNN